jgi:hypothetical protein
LKEDQSTVLTKLVDSKQTEEEEEPGEEPEEDELFNLNDDLFSSFDSLHSIQSSSTFDFIPFGDY